MFVANLVEIHSLMRPADMFLFVKYKDEGNIFVADRENVIGEVTAVGDVAIAHNFAVSEQKNISFKRDIKIGEKIMFRLGSIYHKIIENGETVFCLHMKEVLCCLR
jgi:hypothetical protein